MQNIKKTSSIDKSLDPIIQRVTRGGGVYFFITSFFLVILRLNAIGRLSAELTYDDVGYAIEGLNLQTIFAESGFLGVFTFLLHNPPHAPLQTLIGFFANSISYASATSIYILNAFIVGALLFRIQSMIFGLNNKYGYFIASMIWVSPLGLFMSSSFRPDVIYSLVATLLVVSVQKLQSCEDAISRKNYGRGIAILIASLLYIKPTFIFYTFILFVFSVVVILIGRYLDREKSIHARLVWFQIIGWLSVLSIPFLALFYKQTYEYVIANTIGANSDVWTYPRFYALKWVIYTIVNVSHPTFVAIALLFFLFLLFEGLVKGNLLAFYSFLTYSLFGLACLIPLYFAATLNAWFALTPIMILLAGSSVGFKSFVDSLKRVTIKNASIIRFFRSYGVVLQISTAVLIFSFLITANPRFSIAEHLQKPFSYNTRILNSVLNDCGKNSNCLESSLSQGNTPKVLVSIIGDEVSPDAISWVAYVARWNPQIARLGYDQSLESSINDSDNYEYIVFAKPNILGVNWKIRSNGIQTELLKKISGAAEWQSVAIPIANSDYLLFKKVNNMK